MRTEKRNDFREREEREMEDWIDCGQEKEESLDLKYINVECAFLNPTKSLLYYTEL